MAEKVAKEQRTSAGRKKGEAAKEPKPKHPGGRPSIFTKDLSDIICSRIAAAEAVVSICSEDGMPSLQTFYRWLRENREFRESYEKAKDDSADTMASKIHSVANEPPERGTIDGKVDGGWVQYQRLRVDALKWTASKLKPKVYGDKIDLNHGSQPENPLTVLLQQVQGTPIRPAGSKDSE